MPEKVTLRILGMLGIMCTILWSLFATNKPEECKFMGEKEKHYLNYHLAFASSISGHGMVILYCKN